MKQSIQMDFDTIKLAIEGKIVRISLNRPDQHNALNSKMMYELIHAFEEINNYNDVIVVTLQGEGKSFCSGADLQWMKDSVHLKKEENLKETDNLAQMFEAIYQCKKVVIGVAHGNIFGGGNGLLAACDIAYCTENSRFSLSETRIGLVAATISPYLLRRVSPAVIKELVFTARQFDGKTAESIGLVNRSFSSFDDMNTEVEKTIGAILLGGPKSVLDSKKLINYLGKTQFSQKLNKKLAKKLAKARVSDEAQEGMQAFLVKRNPKWIE